MGPDIIIIRGMGMHIMHGRGHGDLMFTTIRGRAGLAMQDGAGRMDGMHIKREMNTQDGGGRQKTIRYTVQLKGPYIAKDTIRHIVGRQQPHLQKICQAVEDELSVYNALQLSTIPGDPVYVVRSQASS
jgi:hypothetical protein